MTLETNTSQRVIDQVEDITPAWLTSVLSKPYLKEREQVIECTANQIAIGEGFSGRLYRLCLTFRTRKPSTLIAKLATDYAPIKQAMGPQTLYREARFYKEIAPHVDIDIPEVYYSAYGDNKLVILMEDLGDIGLGSAGLSASVKETRHAFAAIARFHTMWWNHDITKEDWLAPAAGTLDKQELSEALGASLKKYSDQFPYLAKCMEAYLKHVPNMPLDVVQQPPLTLIHGDFHRKNVHFRDGKSPLIFDWQIVEVNTPITDIANWLLMYLTTKDRRKHEVKLLRHYYSNLGKECKKTYSFKQLKSDYRKALMLATVRMYLVLEMVDLDIEGGDTVAPLLLDRIEYAAKDYKLLNVYRSLGVVFWIMRMQKRFAKQ